MREYTYDASGNITEEAGKSISWTPYGKVETIQKETGAGEVRFLYDAHGNRILKEEVDGGNVTRRTWYVYDAAGVLLTTYEQSGVGNQITAKEYMIYGTGRVGVALSNAALNGTPVTSSLYSRVVGGKRYDLTDHLGNVRSTLADVKVRDGSTFAAQVMGYTEYFPFGMVASEGGTAGSFGFNGIERVDELRGAGNYYATDFRGLDPRIGRWLAQDAIVKEWESPYASFANNPILFVDPLGLDPKNAGGSSSGAPRGSAENPVVLPEVTVTAERSILDLVFYGMQQFLDWSATALQKIGEFSAGYLRGLFIGGPLDTWNFIKSLGTKQGWIDLAVGVRNLIILGQPYHPEHATLVNAIGDAVEDYVKSIPHKTAGELGYDFGFAAEKVLETVVLGEASAAIGARIAGATASRASRAVAGVARLEGAAVSNEASLVVQSSKGVASAVIEYANISKGIRSALAMRAGKRGYTLAGYHFQKHASRGNPAWQEFIPKNAVLNPKTYNEAGFKTLKAILRAPGKIERVGNFFEKRLPDGRGVRFKLNGEFKGFLD